MRENILKKVFNRNIFQCTIWTLFQKLQNQKLRCVINGGITKMVGMAYVTYQWKLYIWSQNCAGPELS
jgi:hypothetical protein